MAVTLDASTSSGLIQTADTSGVISLLNNGTAGLTLTSGNLQFNSGYGSVATAYGCRAWVNFNGSTAAIRGSGNVSSITRNTTSDYTVNFTNAMPDANYSALAIGSYSYNSTIISTAPTTSAFRFLLPNPVAANGDSIYVNVAVFR